MSDRKYYVLCKDNCKFEAMTKEQIITAIAEATGNTPTKIDDAFITRIKEQNKGAGIVIWAGTTAEYNAIKNRIPNCIYIKTDDTEIEDINNNIIALNKKIDETNAKIAKQGVVLFEGSMRHSQQYEIADITKYSSFIVDIDGVSIVCALTQNNQIIGSFAAHIEGYQLGVAMLPDHIQYTGVELTLDGNTVVANKTYNYIMPLGDVPEAASFLFNNRQEVSIEKITGLY